ncbi:SDR family oxidoreductase [soil metagenome]
MAVVKVVVTGGAGFIGANLCRQLEVTDAITEVIAYDDLSTGSRTNLAHCGSVRLVEGDVVDGDSLAEVLAGASAVVHLAARPSVPKSIQDPMASHHVNATGTLSVLEAMRYAGVAHVVVASSSSVYGANPVLPKVETLKAAPVSPYAVSKLATESYALAYGACFGFVPLALRFFNVFGPLQAAGHAYAAVVPAFVDAALAGRPLPVYGDGTQTRDFTFVDSVTAMITRAVLERLGHPEPVNLAFGTRVSLLELITVIEDVLGHRLERELRPPRPGDVRDSQADTERLAKLVPGLEPFPLRTGIERTVDWFRSIEAPMPPPGW